MKKILAAFDALKLSESTKDYAIYLAKKTSASLTGIFIEDVPVTAEVPMRTIDQAKLLNAAHRNNRKEAIKDFEASCRAAEIRYGVCRETQSPIQELLHESIYADLVVINVNETFTEYPKATPPVFLRQLLSDTQCPVLVVPGDYREVNKIILLYDGSPSSVYATKIFSAFFENRDEMETEVVTVKSDDDDNYQQNGKLIKEFMNRYYPQASYTVLKGNPTDAISSYLARQTNNALVVMGGQQRSPVLKSFRVTLMDTLMWKLKFPLFIASNK